MIFCRDVHYKQKYYSKITGNYSIIIRIIINVHKNAWMETRLLSLCVFHHIRHKSLRAICLCFVHLLHSSEPCSIWANILTTEITAVAPGHATSTLREHQQSRLQPFKTQCGPRVCDNWVCDGNAGPFGPPKPGVSTSDHCLINNWQRQTNQNNLLPTAKC